MPARNIWLAAVAIACAFASFTAAEEAEVRSRPVVIIASHSILPKGTNCRIVMHPEPTTKSGTTCTVYKGTIKETTKDKVLLTDATVEKHCTKNNPYARLPLLGRYFKVTGTFQHHEETEVRVAVDKIKSITLIEETDPKTAGEKKRPQAQIRP